jgi:hypothetical protein
MAVVRARAKGEELFLQWLGSPDAAKFINETITAMQLPSLDPVLLLFPAPAAALQSKLLSPDSSLRSTLSIVSQYIHPLLGR